MFENSYTFHNFSLNLPPSKTKFCPPGQFLMKFLQVFDISREKKIVGQRLEVQRVERLEGQWVERLEGWMLGRLEGLKVERQEKTSWKLIPSTIPSL